MEGQVRCSDFDQSMEHHLISLGSCAGPKGLDGTHYYLLVEGNNAVLERLALLYITRDKQAREKVLRHSGERYMRLE